MTKPQTIQIFLPEGEARGIRIAEITARIVNAVCIPRNKIQDAQKRKEVNRVGVYFLFGEGEEDVKPVVYIGEAEDVHHRLKQHNRNKDFWNTAIVVTSKDANLNKACAKFLEWYCYNKANEIKRYRLENNAEPTKSAISEADEAYSLDFFENMSVLLSVLGFPVFNPLKKAKKQEQFICKGKKALAHGEYTDDGFLVLAESKANIDESRSIQEWIMRIRRKLIDTGMLKQIGDVYVFNEDSLFNTPSAAAATVLGRSANGWTEWKTKDGKTLDELKRK